MNSKLYEYKGSTSPLLSRLLVADSTYTSLLLFVHQGSDNVLPLISL